MQTAKVEIISVEVQVYYPELKLGIREAAIMSTYDIVQFQNNRLCFPIRERVGLVPDQEQIFPEAL